MKNNQHNRRPLGKILAVLGVLAILLTPLFASAAQFKTINNNIPFAMTQFDYMLHQDLYGKNLYPDENYVFYMNQPGFFNSPYYYSQPYDYRKNIYDCEIVGEDGKTFDSNIYYDSPTFDYVQTLLNNENDNIKNITNGFKPSKKFLKCHVATVPEAYEITPTELNCRVLDDKSKVLSDKSYNIAQVLNFSEQIEAENANATDSAGKKKLQCVKKGMSYDVFDKKPEEEKDDTNDKTSGNDNNTSSFPIAVAIVVGIIATILVIGLIVKLK